MSIQFSDTSTYNGLAQLYEKELGFPRGFVTGDTDRFKEFTVDVNLSLTNYNLIALKSSGTWQFDDTSTYESDGVTLRKYPIIKANLVSGQRDYTFSTDQQGNLILDIYKVMILPSATSTIFQDVDPIDVQSSRGDSNDIASERNGQSAPFQYEKTGNGILLDPIPNYTAASGLKIYINREPSYFSYSDTTKKPGIPTYHEYLFLKPALDYAQRNSLTLAGGILRGGIRTGLVSKVYEIEQLIIEYFSQRERDVRHVMSGKKILYI